MAKRPNQRLKLLYLAKIMLRLTDDEHGLQVEQIINELAKYDIAAERKSIYSDLEALQLFGIDIEKKHIGRYVYYCVGNRNLELAELKLLVDAVQSSKFITEKKSSQLIEKLERYVSQYEAKQLNQQVYVHGRIKTMNESIYYNVDEMQKKRSKVISTGKYSKLRREAFWNVFGKRGIGHAALSKWVYRCDRR